MDTAHFKEYLQIRDEKSVSAGNRVMRITLTLRRTQESTDSEVKTKMALNVRNVEYFYIRIEESREKAYQILAQLAAEEVNLLAFSAVPFGPDHVELTIFPDRSDAFIQLARRLGWVVAGPQHAFLVQGDDHLGALADIQRMLLEADVEIYASSGVTDGSGHFGYVIYFKQEDHERAARALGAVTLPTNA